MPQQTLELESIKRNNTAPDKSETICYDRPKNETVREAQMKVWKLKQNLIGLCFKILALIFSKGLFHGVDLRVG